MQKDNLICTCIKSLIKEKEMYLRQGLCIGVQFGYYMALDNKIKILDLAVQSFRPLPQTGIEKETKNNHNPQDTRRT